MLKCRLLRASATIASVLAALYYSPCLSVQTITYEGVIYDQTDFQSLNLGKAGYWFPNFGAHSAVDDRWTGENPRDALPAWAGPLNHVSTNPLDGDAISNNPLTFATRTFSQDGPARSEGGQPNWNNFTLPNGEFGRSGAIVDSHTANGNTNNSINRIQLRGIVPETFYFSIITDNTNNEHNPATRLRARGGAGESFPGVGDEDDISPVIFPQTSGLLFNGKADVYTFKFTGFSGGDALVQTDFIKLQFGGGPNGASFGGLLFDETFQPTAVPEPNGFAMFLVVGIGLCIVMLGKKFVANANRGQLA